MVLCQDATIAELGMVFEFNSPLPPEATFSVNRAMAARCRAIIYVTTATAIVRRNNPKLYPASTEHATKGLFLGAEQMAEGLSTMGRNCQQNIHWDDSFMKILAEAIDPRSIHHPGKEWKSDCRLLLEQAGNEVLRHDQLMDQVEAKSSDAEMERWLAVEEVAREQEWRQDYDDAVGSLEKLCKESTMRVLWDKLPRKQSRLQAKSSDEASD